jgi:hypothetical protein
MHRAAASLAVSSLLAFVTSGCLGSSGGAKLSTFAGLWQGHAHTMKISDTGYATEWVYIGADDFIVKLEFRLSRPGGTSRSAKAVATVTHVRLGHASDWFSKSLPVPRVGESRTIRLNDGVILEPFTDAYYCGRVWKSQCGA